MVNQAFLGAILVGIAGFLIGVRAVVIEYMEEEGITWQTVFMISYVSTLVWSTIYWLITFTWEHYTNG